MAEKDENQLQFSEDKTKSSSFFAYMRRLKLSFFNIFYLQYKSSNSSVRQYSKQRQKIFHSINMIVYSIQLVSLTFPPTTPNWSSFVLFSEIISSIRGDYLLVILGLEMPCYFIALVFTMIPFLSIVILMFKSLKKMTFDIENYQISLTAGLSLIKNVTFVPFLCIFAAAQKFAVSGAVPQYSTNSNISLPIPYLGMISSIFAVILILMAAVENTFQYQQFLTKKKTFIFARAHSKIETLKIILSTGLVYSHFYIQETQYSAHLIYAFAVGLTLWYLYTFYMPFFNHFTNYTHSSAYLLLLWISVVCLLGIPVANSSVVFVLIIFVSPCLIYLQWDMLKIQKKHISSNFGNKILLLDNIYKCELLIRAYSEELLKITKKHSENDQIIFFQEQIFNVFKYMKKRFKTSNMQVVWEFIFAFSLIKDEGLARIRLTEISSYFDIEGSFLYYKYLKIIDDFSSVYLEEVDFVKFRRLYDEALKGDKKTCQLQHEFWKELSLERPNVKNLEVLGFKLYENIKKCKKNLKKLTGEYSNNQLALHLHGTFLLEVYNDNSKGNDLLSKAEHEKKQQELRNASNYEKFSHFDNNNGIIIVSGSSENLGCITSINQPACDILKTQINFAVSMNIANFLPPPMNNPRVHNSFLSKFLVQSTTTKVASPFVSAFIDSTNFLVEVYLQINCVAINSQPYFLAGVKKCNLNREAILFDGDVIIASTRGFAKLIEYSDTEISLKGYSTNAVINDFTANWKNRDKKETFLYKIPQTVNFISMRFTSLMFKNKGFNMLIASDDSEEISQWDLQRETVMIDDILDKKHTISSNNNSKSMQKKGILRLRPPTIKKNLSVKFNIDPIYHLLPFTDFKPGKLMAGRVKDAATLKNDSKTTKKTVEWNAEIEKKPEGQVVEFLDLKDLGGELLKKADSDKSESANEENQNVGKKSGASIASSAQSSNASFTSSAEAQKLLEGVTTSMKSFKIAFFLTIFIVDIAIIAMIVYLRVVTDSFNDCVIIKELSERRSLMANITTFARDLQFIAQGLSNYQEAEIRTLMYNDIVLYQNIVAMIEAKISKWDLVSQSIYTSPEIQTWKLIGLSPVATPDNLLNAMKNFISSAFALSKTPISQINSNNSDLFYLYRNGLAESLIAINNSNQVFINQQQINTNNIVLIILSLALAAILLMVICFFAVIIPTLFSVEKSNATVWKLFYLLPLDLIQEMLSRSEERLEMTHGVEGEIDDTQKFRNLSARKKIKLQRKWPIILIRISLYYLLSTGLFVFCYYMIYINFGNSLRNKPVLMNTSELRTFSTTSAFFWLQELQYYNSGLSYSNQIKTGQFLPSPELEIEKYLQILDHSEKVLAYGDYSDIGKNSIHEGYLMDKECFNSGCLLLEKGLHSGILNFVSDVRYSVENLKQGKNMDFSTFFNRKNEITYGETVLFNMYNDFMMNEINSNVNLVTWIASTYCIIVILMFLFIYIPVINSVKSEITKIWKLGRLIPIEHRNKIMQAFKEASGIKHKPS